MADEDVWKKRFMVFTLARLFGLAMVLLGGTILFTDLVREGGWPLLGGLFIVMGVIDAVFSPRLLKKVWEEQDRQQP
ncbi:MAG TPA: hypothetical protein VFK50_00350 [Sphingomicrobium sp.]|nr:hypothetical protein [Sphingomicrobium sp.]